MVETDGLAEAIKAYIEDTVAASEFNCLREMGNVRVADTPLVGFADGFKELLKRVLGNENAPAGADMSKFDADAGSGLYATATPAPD